MQAVAYTYSECSQLGRGLLYITHRHDHSECCDLLREPKKGRKLLKLSRKWLSSVSGFKFYLQFCFLSRRNKFNSRQRDQLITVLFAAWACTNSSIGPTIQKYHKIRIRALKQIELSRFSNEKGKIHFASVGKSYIFPSSKIGLFHGTPDFTHGQVSFLQLS